MVFLGVILARLLFPVNDTQHNAWKATLLEKLDRLPPCVCRLLAQRDGRLLTEQQMKRLTGWSLDKLSRIASARTWRAITAGDIDKFLSACGLSWSAQSRSRWYLKIAVRRGAAGIERMRHVQRALREPSRAGSVTLLLRRTEQILKTH